MPQFERLLRFLFARQFRTAVIRDLNLYGAFYPAIG
jgi:hypothetical protein